MRVLAAIGGAVAGLAILRWLIVRWMPWDPEWMAGDDDDATPFDADPYVLDLIAEVYGR